MAWVKEYDLNWRGLHASGTIELQRDGGSYQKHLILINNSLEINNVLPSWEESIVRTNCSFSILNDFDDFYDSIPLMTISNGQYKVVVKMTSPGTATLFEGYLNCEIINQVMLKSQNIEFTASGLLSKLDYDHPGIIDTLQNISLIDLIDDCLTMTGSSYDIRVNCTLYEVNNALSSGQTLFNKTGINTELFWKNNVDRDSTLEILNKILKAFNCILYWYQGYWYIEHYEDLGLATKQWITYTTGASYEYDDTGSSNNVAANQLTMHDKSYYEQANTAQLLSINPGLKQLNIKLNQKQYFNYFNGDLSGAQTGTDSVLREYPHLRTWYAYEGGGSPPDGIDWYNPWLGEPWYNIANAAYKTGAEISDHDGYWNGLTTHFLITCNPDTELQIKYKLGLIDGQPFGDFWDNPGNYTIHHYWFLRTGLNGYFYYDTSTKEWSYEYPGSLIYGNITDYDGTAFETTNPSGKGSMEITHTIPIGKIMCDYHSDDEWSGDLDLIFRCGQNRYEGNGYDDPNTAGERYGDFTASIDESADDNKIEGEINTDFLNKKEINLDLFDSSWNYRNTLLCKGTDPYGSAWIEKTEEWSWGESAGESLIRRLMESKFRLYRIARQKIKIQYLFYGTTASWTLRPLIMFMDNKQSNKEFIMLEDRHRPEEDIHEVLLWEYDDSETINLI